MSSEKSPLINEGNTSGKTVSSTLNLWRSASSRLLLSLSHITERIGTAVLSCDCMKALIYSVLVMIAPLTPPFVRTGLFAASIFVTGGNYSCLKNASHSNWTRPTNFFLHGDLGSDIFERGIEIIYLLSKFLYFLVFLILGHSIYKHYENVASKITMDSFKQLVSLLILFVALAYIFVGWVITSLEISDLVCFWRNESNNSVYKYCNASQELEQVYKILMMHHSLGFPFHYIEALILVLMMLSSKAVCKRWKYAIKTMETLAWPNPTLWPRNSSSYNYEYEFNQCYVEAYEELKDLLKLHQTWFVVQWIAYFLVSTADLIYTMRLILTTSPTVANDTAYIFLYFSYEFSSLMIPYICGALMNKAHTRFYEKLQDNLKQIAKSLKTVETHIERNPKCDFVPKIFYINIDIPISSPGYLISILFDVFVLLCTLVTSGPLFWSVT